MHPSLDARLVLGGAAVLALAAVVNFESTAESRDREEHHRAIIGDADARVAAIAIPEVIAEGRLGTPTPNVPRILVTRSSVQLDLTPTGDATIQTIILLDRDLYPLGLMLPRAPQRAVEVVADGTVSATTVLRLIEWLAGPAFGIDHAWLRVRTQRGIEAIDLVARAQTWNDRGGVAGDALVTEAVVRKDGVVIDAIGGALVPGCRSTGDDALTVPNSAGELDDEALVASSEGAATRVSA